MMEKRRQGTAEFPMHPGIDEEREKSAERGMMTAERHDNYARTPIDAGWYFWNGSMFDKASEPTHWQPLP